MKPNHNQPKCEHCSVKEPMSFCEGIIGLLVEPMVPMKSEQDTLIGMLTRTGTPFMFSPVEEDDVATAVTVPFLEAGDVTLTFLFNENGYCVTTLMDDDGCEECDGCDGCGGCGN